jgi:hypothetical protein
MCAGVWGPKRRQRGRRGLRETGNGGRGWRLWERIGIITIVVACIFHDFFGFFAFAIAAITLCGMIPSPDPPRVYRLSAALTSRAWVFFAGGAGLVLVALFGFFLAIHARSTPLHLHLATTLPMIGVMAVLFFVGAILSFKGISIVTAPTTGN